MSAILDPHPDDALLMDHARGVLDPAVSLFVATHLALCPKCRAREAEMEALGGELLDEIEPDVVDAATRASVLAMLDDPAPLARRPGVIVGDPRFPEPLRSLVGDPRRLRWDQPLPGVRFAQPLFDGGPRLMRMSGRARVPTHAHDGIELVLVLEGGFHDHLGDYRPGDFVVGDETIEHMPVAEGVGCLCLSMVIGDLRPVRPIGRLMRRLGRF